MTLKEHQSALDIKQQIENLKGKQLIIEDEKAASDFLNDLLPDDEHWQRFVKGLSSLFEKYAHVKKTRMEFPDDWMAMLLDR